MFYSKEIYNLKGHVKSCEEVSYLAQENSLLKDKFHNFYLQFYEDGLIKVLINIWTDEKYNYVVDSNVVALKKYPIKFNQLRQIVLSGDGEICLLERTFFINKRGGLILLNDFNENGELTGYVRYFYDDFGRLKKCVRYNVDEFDSEDIIQEKESFEYNIENEMVSSTITCPKTETRKRVYKINVYGDVIKQKTYDAFNCLVSKEEFTYIYDKHNNWIKKNYYLNGEKELFIRRSIKYY